MKAIFEQDWAATDAGKRASENGNTLRFDRLSRNCQIAGCAQGPSRSGGTAKVFWGVK